MISETSNQIPRVQYFISYTGVDEEWARWVAWELERAGYTYRLQAEHFVPGTKFINAMRIWLDNCDHVLALMTEEYFKSEYASLEMHSAVGADPLGAARRVIPIRVKKCTVPSLFRDIVYIDFVGRSEEEQRRALVAGLKAARIGGENATREFKTRPIWPGRATPTSESHSLYSSPATSASSRLQFIASDVGRGLDLKGQFEKIQAALSEGPLTKLIKLKAEFDVTDANLFAKLNAFRPNIVHFSGNQNGGDVLFPSHDGGEIVVPDEALAGLLSSLGSELHLVIIDTCKSYRCAKRIAEVVEFAIGVEGDITDSEAILFYEIFYKAIAAAHSLADAHGQATAALGFRRTPMSLIPKLISRNGLDPSKKFLG
jgi:hypothetical protein